jgi:hypothetical protein
VRVEEIAISTGSIGSVWTDVEAKTRVSGMLSG